MKQFQLIAMLFSAITASAQFSESFEKPLSELTSKGWSFDNTWQISTTSPIDGTSSLMSGTENFQTYVVRTTSLGFKSSGFFTFRYAFSRLSTQSALMIIDIIDDKDQVVKPIGSISVTPSQDVKIYTFQTDFTGNYRVRIAYKVNNSNSALMLDGMAHSAAVILPVTWEKVWLDRQPAYNKLFWTVEENDQTDRYEVQYSSDGINFKTIYVAKASGTKQRKTYSFTHNGKQ